MKGENIQKTMFEIEGMMETIAGAFEKQLDSLFDDDALHNSPAYALAKLVGIGDVELFA